jgi:hypothetical protein
MASGRLPSLLALEVAFAESAAASSPVPALVAGGTACVQVARQSQHSYISAIRPHRGPRFDHRAGAAQASMIVTALAVAL